VHLEFRHEVADSLEGGSGHNSEDHANRPELLPHSRAEHAIRQRQEIDWTRAQDPPQRFGIGMGCQGYFALLGYRLI